MAQKQTPACIATTHTKSIFHPDVTVAARHSTRRVSSCRVDSSSHLALQPNWTQNAPPRLKTTHDDLTESPKQTAPQDTITEVRAPTNHRYSRNVHLRPHRPPMTSASFLSSGTSNYLLRYEVEGLQLIFMAMMHDEHRALFFPISMQAARVESCSLSCSYHGKTATQI